MPSPDLYKRCLDCGYILDGLPEPRCPECGRAFDPDKPETYVVKPKCGAPYLIAASGAVFGLVAACGMAAFALRNLFSFRDSGVARVCAVSVFLLLLGSIFLGSWTVSRCLKALDLPHAATCHRSCYKIALGLGIPFRLLLYLPPELTFVLVAVLAIALFRFLACR
jgi:hypothetical protein